MLVDVLCFSVLFKQMTAYEMRISDWSSDVCSSDLLRATCKGGSPLSRLPPGSTLSRSLVLGRRDLRVGVVALDLVGGNGAVRLERNGLAVFHVRHDVRGAVDGRRTGGVAPAAATLALTPADLVPESHLISSCRSYLLTRITLPPTHTPRKAMRHILDGNRQ